MHKYYVDLLYKWKSKQHLYQTQPVYVELPTSPEREQWFDDHQYNTEQYMIIHYIFYCATATEGEQWFDGHQVARGQSLGPPGPPTTYKP